LAAWSRELGISETAILYRLETGQPIRRALRGRRGPGDRTRTGRDPAATIRFPPKILAAIDESAARQTDKPGRSEAIRRLVENAFAAKKT
jgi:hypothetical protein